ncbi:MAG: glycosyltransferase [Hyphomicrobiaceae bacterium]|nr:glycosyltransferase [Hyphomicrobiaceae bacterium]
MSAKAAQGLYIVHLSMHGLIRGHDLELGRDADTGGQIKYVVELAAALAQRAEVARVDLLTRLIADPKVHTDYAKHLEAVTDKFRIVRIEAGPSETYLPKEQLWDHLDSFIDSALMHLRSEARLPDLLHAHYADAGYVGTRLSQLLGVPLIFTGHSLGRVKRRRLMATGLSSDAVEYRYNMRRRVEAEEMTLANAERVVTSTHQEIDEQYELYDHYQPDQMRVIPPGIDLELFHPPRQAPDRGDQPAIITEINRFLRNPQKPAILALSRPDARKNIGALVDAYGRSDELRERANLIVIAGNRDEIASMDEGAQEVLTDMLMLVDRYDLYGSIAYPKHHASSDIPAIYRHVAKLPGVFVNPALTEPFGLTLIEAAASGLPIAATRDGGPTEIIGNCSNGILIDPLDGDDITAALLRLLKDRPFWQQCAANGLTGVATHYSWDAHARTYLADVMPVIDKSGRLFRPAHRQRGKLYHDRALFTDLDQNLLGDPDSIPAFIELMRNHRTCAHFGIATGRRLDSALRVLRRHNIPEPDVLITSAGTQIHYAPELTSDVAWVRHIDHHWTPPPKIRQILAGLPGLKLQPPEQQSHFKVSYYYDATTAPPIDEIISLLHKEELSVNVTHSFGQYIDIMPVRASKGLALRYVMAGWGVPLEQTLVAGGSGSDEDMMRGNTLAVVVANRHHEELSRLTDLDSIYFATEPHARGIIEAIHHFDFFGTCRVPTEDKGEPPRGAAA